MFLGMYPVISVIFRLISFSFASVYVVISTSPFLDNASLTKNVVLPEPATADIKRFLFTPIYCIFNILGILQIMFFLKYSQSPICFISLHILRDYSSVLYSEGLIP